MTDYDPQSGREMPADPDPAAAQAEADEVDLQDGLTGLARMVSDSFSVDDLLAQVATLATHAIPGADVAGLALVRGTSAGHVETVGTTADVMREIDRIQYELLAEGPCVTCMQVGRPIVSGSLGSDERWPRFGGRIARLGVHSALSLPLLIRGRVIGAINAYARTRDAFSEHAVRLGEQFAAAAAVSAHNAQLLAAASTKAEQLQAALTSRAVIDQAIGILRSRTGGTPEEAFDRLRQISQSENVRLSLVAQRFVDEAVNRARARHARQ
jgi:GAF domain-containing protein